MARRKISKKILEKEPYQLWNLFIDILAMEDKEKLSDIQKTAQRVFWYDSEVQNGGHVQYFANTDLEDYTPVIDSLEFMGAKSHAAMLEKAVKIYFRDGRKNLDTVKKLIEESLKDENRNLDIEYCEIKPDIHFYLKEYLNKYTDEFIETE